MEIVATGSDADTEISSAQGVTINYFYSNGLRIEVQDEMM